MVTICILYTVYLPSKGSWLYVFPEKYFLFCSHSMPTNNDRKELTHCLDEHKILSIRTVCSTPVSVLFTLSVLIKSDADF